MAAVGLATLLIKRVVDAPQRRRPCFDQVA
jgi:hypothetical protein